MKINNYLLNEILQINDISLIDVILYIFNDYQKTAGSQIFNTSFFLKSTNKVTTNKSYITDKMKASSSINNKSKGVKLSDFLFCEKLNNNEVVFEFKQKYIDFFSDENLRRNYTEIDVSIVYNLHSLYAKKMYIFFEMNRFKVDNKTVYTKITINDFKNSLNIICDLNGDLNRIIKRFFSEIKKMLPNYPFKISYKKESRKIVSLFCFFDEAPEEVENDNQETYKKEYIEIPKSNVEIKEEIIPPTPKIEFKQEFIETAVNYQPVIENVVTIETKKTVNNINDENMIDMDNDKINNLFGDIDFILNNPKEEVINENEKYVKPKIASPVITPVQTIPIVPKEEIKEVPKTLLDKTMNYIRNIDNCKYEMMFIDEPKMVTKFEIKENNKVVVIDFRDLWSKQNLLDNNYLPNINNGSPGKILKFIRQVTGNDFDMKITVKGDKKWAVVNY